MLNTKKLEKALSTGEMSKTQLCSAIGIARSTLDAILNGSDTKISTIESITKALNIKIGFLFDEEIVVEEYHAHGEKGMAVKKIGKVDQRTMPGCTNSTGEEMLAKKKGTAEKEEAVEIGESREELKKQIDTLQKELLEAQAKIINLMENRK